MKNCAHKNCSEINPQPLSAFYKSKSKPDGLNIHCKKCSSKFCKATEKKHGAKYNEKRKEYWAKNKERFNFLQRKNMLWNSYKITPEQWQEMFEVQSGCCKICGIHASELKKPLAVDHCHKTGMVRALLCYHCNWLIGHAKESTEILNSAIKYLEEHSA